MTADFNRAEISVCDFEEAEVYLVELPNASSDIMRKALLVAAIIAYGRPFTSNEKGKSPKASSKVALINNHLLSDEQQAMHSHLMTLRNKAIAHSEFSRNPVSLGDVQKNRISFKKEPFQILTEQISPAQFLALCRRRKKQAMDTSFVAAQAAAPVRDAL